MTSSFGTRYHPIDHARRLHAGIDLVSLPGPGPVLAASTGRVTAAGTQPGTGNTVEVDHVGGITTRYAHLATIDPTIGPGTPVAIGQVLGVQGSTGTSTGNHLHFEIHPNGGQDVNPLPYLKKAVRPLFAAKRGSVFSLGLRGDVVAAGAGTVAVEVDRVRRYPGGSWLDVDPRTLPLPYTRLNGPEMRKWVWHLSRYGTSITGMPAVEVHADPDGRLMIMNGVTRAARAAKFHPGTPIRVEVTGAVPSSVAHLPLVGDRLP